MALGDPPNKRKAHVKRIWKSNDDGTPNKNVWVDMLRLDKLPIVFSGTSDGIQGQTVNFKFAWKDIPGDSTDATNPQNEDANPNRKARRLYVKNPKSPDDDSQTNTLWIVDKSKITMPQGSPFGLSGQNVNFTFDNANPYSVKSADPPYDENQSSAKRDVTVIKVVTNDLGGMSMEDGDVSRIVDWDTYKAALIAGKANQSSDDSTDPDQGPPHLDVEVDNNFRIAFGADAKTGAQGQIVKYVLSGNKELYDDTNGDPLFKRGNADAVDSNGDPSVIRTDPLQIIVNASFRPPDPIAIGWRWAYNVKKESIVDDVGGMCAAIKVGPKATTPYDCVFPLNATASNCGYVSFIILSKGDKSTNPTSPMDLNLPNPHPTAPDHSDVFIKGKFTFDVTPEAPDTISFGALTVNGSVWTKSFFHGGRANDPQFPGYYSAVGKSSANLTQPLYSLKIFGCGPGWYAGQDELDNPEAVIITLLYCDGYTTPDSYLPCGTINTSISGKKDAQWKSNDGKQTIDYELYAVAALTDIGGGYPTVGVVSFNAYFKAKGSKTPDSPKV